MLFSVITVTYNAASTLPFTLASVEQQSFRDFEYLLIDGGSKDSTVPLAQKSQIVNKRIVSEPDRGLYDAMNKGLRMAQGEYVIFLNAGDAFPSVDTLAEYAAAIETAPMRPGMAYGQTMLVDTQRQIIGPRNHTAPAALSARDFARGMLVCHQAMAVRRDLAEPFDLQYRFSADFDWAVKVLKRSLLNVYVGSVTAHYLSEGLTTANRNASLLERFRIMCRHYGTLPTVWHHIGFAFRMITKIKV